MLQVLSTTVPIFLLIGIGFLAARLQAMTVSDIRALGIFVMKFALPALIFKLLSQRSISEIANAQYLLAYSAASTSVFAANFAIARFALRRSIAASAIQSLGTAASNSGYIGFPIALLALGPPAAVALALCMIVENVLMIPLALALAESGGQDGKRPRELIPHLAGRLARNPLILAMLAGVAFSVSGLRPPEPVFRPIDLLAGASSPAALFAVGGALAGLRFKGMIGDVARIVAGKLILHPLAALLALALFAPTLDPALKKAMLIYASAPMLGIFPLLSRQYGQERIAAAALMAATLLSFLTISGLLAAL